MMFDSGNQSLNTSLKSGLSVISKKKVKCRVRPSGNLTTNQSLEGALDQYATSRSKEMSKEFNLSSLQLKSQESSNHGSPSTMDIIISTGHKVHGAV
jgi:hypothetical protein